MTGSDPIDTVPVSDRPRRATPWTGLGIGVGLLSIVIGLLVLFWPGASVVVIAWLFAIPVIAFRHPAARRRVHGRVGNGNGGSRPVGCARRVDPCRAAVPARAATDCRGARTAHRSDLGDRWRHRDRARDRCGSGRPPWLAYHLRGALRARWGRRSGLSRLSFVAMTWLFGIVLSLIGVVLLAESFMTRREGSRAFAEAGGRHSSAAAPSST
jgi:Short repeat of unknown function (DUF308)